MNRKGHAINLDGTFSKQLLSDFGEVYFCLLSLLTLSVFLRVALARSTKALLWRAMSIPLST
jgi:hypothetical protein